MLKMTDLDLHHQRVMIREDLNVPMQNGYIMDFSRIDRAIPTIQLALRQDAAVIILSHLGRPEEGKFDPQFSLKLIADALAQKLNRPVRLVSDWLEGVIISPGEVVLCENVRFLRGENENSSVLAEKMASLCDVFVMDAFATAHRAQASTEGVIRYAKKACAGPLLMEELDALSVLKSPKRPLVAIVGGSKVSTKLQLIENLLKKVDTLILGGGIANTFLAAIDVPMGISLYEKDFVGTAKKILKHAQERGISIPFPQDVRVAHAFSSEQKAVVRMLGDVRSDEMILDVGPLTEKTYPAIMQQAATIVWNGPIGVFEFPEFSHGTHALAEAVAESSACSVAGGGETVSALAQFSLTDKMSYVSTAGGAFLEWLEGKTLPAIFALEERA